MKCDKHSYCSSLSDFCFINGIVKFPDIQLNPKLQLGIKDVVQVKLSLIDVVTRRSELIYWVTNYLEEPVLGVI